MTRFLSLALGAREPEFSQSIQQLEQAAGRPSTDIRLTSELTQCLRMKINELGLDPDDTTGPELYNALQERFRRDETTARKALGLDQTATANEIVADVVLFLDKYAPPGTCFALKTSVAKKLLKKKVPKLAMKRLGYRSVDSMLKHESVASLYTAALITEPEAWHASFREQYAKLTPSDFETRPINVAQLDAKRWQTMGAEFAASNKHHIISFRELGAVVVLPMSEAVEGMVITTILLILEELNGIRAHSSYTKLQQVKPDFGRRVQYASVSEPYTAASLAGQPVPWRMIQRYYGRFQEAYHPEVFEPHVQLEDLDWRSGEDVLLRLHSSLGFWRGTQNLGLIHDGAPVSCNALDVALGYCNKLPFHERIVHFVRDNLWHELMMRYLHQDNLEAAVHQQLAGELADPDLANEEAEAV